MNDKPKLTVAAIAKEAGVSPATVSRVLNQKNHLVTGKTAKLVEETIKKMGYDIPEPKVSIPKEQPVIIFNVPNIGNPFYTEVIQGAISSASAHGCYLLVNQSPLDYGSIDKFFNLIQRVNAAGVILLNQVPADILYQINKVVPLVQCGEYNPDSNLPFVSINDQKAAQEATEYIISSGHNKIAFINGPSSFKYSRERRQGFLAALDQASLTIPHNWIVELPDISYEMAYAAICQLMNSEVKPNAYFTASDTLAAAVLQAAKRYHYHVPNDIIVVGFDNTEISYLCTPSITTVSQPKFQLGFTSCEMILKKINAPETELHSILLETELILRESTHS